MSDWHPCLKQKTRTTIVVPTKGTPLTFEATNACHVGDATVCPRVTAGCVSGEGYELCGPPIHSEAAAAALYDAWRQENGVFAFLDGGPVAYIDGHTYSCMDCQHALTAVGVKVFVITGRPA